MEDLPAPGQYEARSTIQEGPQYSIYQKRDQKIEQTPGPGDYNEPEKEKKGVTIGKRIADKKVEDLPAPGQYESKSALVEGPQYSIYQKRDQKIEQTPGPGDYNQPDKEQKGVTIGKRLVDKKVEDLPAPGQYEARSTIQEGPQYSIYQKRDQKIEQTPGPGDYNQPEKEQKGVTIGKRINDKKVEDLPAPGQYEARSTIQEGPQYSIYQKRDQKIEQTPGPGDYNQPEREQKGVTIGQRIADRKIEDLPAPGQYSTKSALVEGPQYSIYQKREQKIEQTPGPGDYNQPENEQKGVTIGKRIADKKVEDLPAPGQYATKSHIVEGPQYSIYQKRETKIEQKPGPGDYNLPEKEQKGVTIGKRLADKTYLNNIKLLFNIIFILYYFIIYFIRKI